jgi:DNA replication protein DnaC
MAEDPMKAVLHYAQALKAPRIRESAARLAEQARDAGWTHEEYLAAVLSREVSAREASGAATRIRSAGFPTRKSLEGAHLAVATCRGAGEGRERILKLSRRTLVGGQLSEPAFARLVSCCSTIQRASSTILTLARCEVLTSN